MRTIANNRKALAPLIWGAKAYLYSVDNVMLSCCICFALLSIVARQKPAKDFCFWYGVLFGFLSYEFLGLNFYYYDSYTIAPAGALYMVFWERLAEKFLG